MFTDLLKSLSLFIHSFHKYLLKLLFSTHILGQHMISSVRPFYFKTWIKIALSVHYVPSILPAQFHVSIKRNLIKIFCYSIFIDTRSDAQVT